MTNKRNKKIIRKLDDLFDKMAEYLEKILHYIENSFNNIMNSIRVATFVISVLIVFSALGYLIYKMFFY